MTLTSVTRRQNPSERGRSLRFTNAALNPPTNICFWASLFTDFASVLSSTGETQLAVGYWAKLGRLAGLRSSGNLSPKGSLDGTGDSSKRVLRFAAISSVSNHVFWIRAEVPWARTQVESDAQMENCTTRTWNNWRRHILTAAGVIALAVPGILGTATAPMLRTQSSSPPSAPPAPDRPRFEVASIKPSKSGEQGTYSAPSAWGTLQGNKCPVASPHRKRVFESVPAEGRTNLRRSRLD